MPLRGATAPNITVVGAGVVGLSTAVLLQAAGYHVTVIATHTPDHYDEHAALYASPKAGAHWRSVAHPDDAKYVEIDRITLKLFQKLAKISDTGVIPMPSFDIYMDEHAEPLPWFKNEVENFNMLAEDALYANTKWGFSYLAYTFNTPKYLAWMTRLFKRLGGKIAVKTLQHIDDAASPTTAAVINCTGLGARTLGGVEDTNVYPTRGQIVIVRAPHVKYTITRLGDDIFDYVIPREDGLVILGGTYQEGADSMQPDPATAKRILENAVAICPQLQLWPGQKLEVVAHRVGLRPTRKGGIRLEHEWRAPTTTTKRGGKEGKKTLVVHNYGHGGGGYQSSWGSAHHVLQIVHEQLAPAGKQSAAPAGVKSFDVAVRRILAVGNIKSKL
ncbi:hypothetical protein GGF31_000427 [Allomyces arbusculus]|nr:hypothetical protein GGF31_000427 [Allomyces arbusculus]